MKPVGQLPQRQVQPKGDDEHDRVVKYLRHGLRSAQGECGLFGDDGGQSYMRKTGAVGRDMEEVVVVHVVFKSMTLDSSLRSE